MAPAVSCLIGTLQFLRDHVDNVCDDVEAWEQWERFGASFHALRINALLMLGYNSVPMSWLVPGGGARRVKLRPMKVVRAAEQMSVSVTTILTDAITRAPFNWLDWDGVGCVVINGTSGMGIDVFFALESEHESEASLKSCILVLDQRKRVAHSLGTASVSQLVQKAIDSGTPKVVDGRHANLFVCLFSLLASCSAAPPPNSTVVSYLQHDHYHGSLSAHHAASPAIDINWCNVSTMRLLRSLNSNDGKIAKLIITQRDEGKFASVEGLVAFLGRHNCTLTDSELQRLVVTPPHSNTSV
jgi:hypothetical protein